MAFGKNFKGGAKDYGRPREDRGGFGGGGFKKPWENRGDKPRGGFGGDRGDRGPVEMHSATCSNCNKQCEVPFRPNGTKPVYCKDCFSSMKGADERGPRDGGERGGFGSRQDSHSGRPERSDRPAYSAPRVDAGNTANLQAQIDKLAKKVDGLAVSLDYAIQLLKGTSPAVKKEEVTAKAEAKSEVKSAAKAVVSKESRLAKKAPAKKAAKKGKK